MDKKIKVGQIIQHREGPSFKIIEINRDFGHVIVVQLDPCTNKFPETLLNPYTDGESNGKAYGYEDLKEFFLNVITPKYNPEYVDPSILPR